MAAAAGAAAEAATAAAAVSGCWGKELLELEQPLQTTAVSVDLEGLHQHQPLVPVAVVPTAAPEQAGLLQQPRQVEMVHLEQ